MISKRYIFAGTGTLQEESKMRNRKNEKREESTSLH
jgi:hypothetical protein